MSDTKDAGRYRCHGCGSVYGSEKSEDPELQARACCSLRGFGSKDDYSIYTSSDEQDTVQVAITAAGHVIRVLDDSPSVDLLGCDGDYIGEPNREHKAFLEVESGLKERYLRTGSSRSGGER